MPVLGLNRFLPWEEYVRSGILEFLCVSPIDSPDYVQQYQRSIQLTRQLLQVDRTRILVLPEGLWKDSRIRSMADGDRKSGIRVLVASERDVVRAGPHLQKDFGVYGTVGVGMLEAAGGVTQTWLFRKDDEARNQAIENFRVLEALSVPIEDPYIEDIFDE